MRTRFALAATTLMFAWATTGLLAQVNSEPQPDEDPTGHTGALKGNVETGCGYNAQNGNGVRSVTDLHVPGALGDYGLDFTRHWNSLPPGNEPHMWASMGFSDFGTSGWSHSWAWGAEVTKEYPKELPSCDCTDHYMITWITITFPDGRVIKYKLVRSEIFQFGIPARPWFGPPYESNERDWQIPGEGVHDLLESMAPDGSEFWLHLADGGSVHFVGDSWSGDPNHKDWSYQAKQVFDPHGFRTDLVYDPVWNGQLTEVRPEAGRWLKITWGYPINGSMAQVISRVEMGGVEGAPAVDYTYAVTGNVLTLGTAEYGGGVSATYVYQNALLVEATDPRFAGAMTRIRYKYRMDRCQVHPVSDPPDAHFDYIYAQPEAIAEEQSPYNDLHDLPIVVSRFAIHCWDGTRTEWNGLGGWRNFYYGHSATWSGSGSRGHELAKVTDFTTTGVNMADERQNHLNGKTYQVWDGRNTMTQFTYNDSNGQPNEIRHSGSDGSFRTYDWTDSGNSAQRDPALIHNPHPHCLFSKKDELGHPTTYTRDARRRVTRIDYSGGSAEIFTYNSFNQVIIHQLPSGAVRTYEYDPSHRLQFEHNSVDYPASALDYTEYTYYGPGDHPEWTDLVKTKTEGLARQRDAPFTVRMTYNGRQQIATVEYASTTGQYPIVRYEYDPSGNCTSITDEMGHTSHYEYDDYRRCISYTEPLNGPGPDGGNVPSRRWDWIYDRYIVDNNYYPVGDGYKDASAHTANSWRIQVEPAFNYLGERPMTHRFHDLNGRIVLEQTGWIQRPPPAAIGDWYWSGQGETVYYTYDENGQKKTYTDSHGRRTSYEYDLRNRPWKTNETENAVLRTTETLYDLTGNKTMVKFPVETAGQRTQQWLDYDAFGQPGRFIDERGNTTNLVYWWGPMKKLGMVTTHRDKDLGGTEDQVTVFSYDFMGRPTNVWFPDGSYPNGSHEDSTYEFGQLKTWRNRKGQTKYFHYDARGREDSNSWGNTSGTCDPAADNGAAACITRQWDPANRLTSIRNKFATINYTYDDAAQVLSESESISGAGGAAVTGYRRYGNGTVWNLIYPNGMRSARAYSPQLRLQTVWDHGPNNWQLTINYTFADDGKIDHGDYGNGTKTAYGYDGRGMINSVQHTRGDGANLSARTYYRDNRDRITAYQKSTANSVNPMEDGRGNHYQYDAEGQLTDAWHNAVDPVNTYASCLRQDHFAYDALGNRFGWDYVQTKGWMHILRRDNGLNEYTSWENSYPNPPQHWGSGIFYDDNSPWPGYNAFPGNGVTMADGWLVASYDSLNQPVAMIPFGWSNAIYFGYDPLGRCVKRWVGASGNVDSNPATYFYYDGWNLIQEGPSAGSASRQYVHGLRVDEVVAQITPPNNWIRYFHYDASGNCTLQTDAGGGIVEQYEYDAFGYPYFFDGSGNNIGSSPWGNRFLFTGREWLSDLKLYDYRNRMYQPELGRFLQPDPKQFAAGDYNLYRYCHNDPVNRSDPTGLRSELAVEIQKLRLVLGSNIPQWVTTIKVGISGLFEAAKADHQDRTQSVFKDGGLSRITIGKIGTNHTMGRFERNKFRSEEIPLDASRPLALILHIHNDIHNNATAGPSGKDAGAVIGYQVPMVFSSESLYSGGQGILLTPRGQAEPNQVPIDLSR